MLVVILPHRDTNSYKCSLVAVLVSDANSRICSTLRGNSSLQWKIAVVTDATPLPARRGRIKGGNSTVVKIIEIPDKPRPMGADACSFRTRLQAVPTR